MADLKQNIEISVSGVKDVEAAARAMRGMGSAASDLDRSGTSGLDRVGVASKQAADNLRRATLDMTSQRYQLYDVAQGFQMLSDTLTGIGGKVVNLGMEYESAFAQVIRTTGLAGQEVEKVKKELIDLSTKVPESFQNLSGIAAFGGQLGITKNEITDFTKTVAQLKATTDLTLDAAGQGLATFQTTLGVAGKDFDNVASSILKVGVNSAATESQIVNVSTQIGSMAQLAGYSADQVVGLSGAMASVKIPPELSRSIITQVFGKLQKAVQDGGSALEAFAQTSGHSAEEVRQAWGTNKFAGIFTDFLAGLKASGQGATQVLSDIGIKSQRTVPALLRMSQASELVKQTMKDASEGFADTSTLTDQYGQISQTTSARVEMLKNSFANLGAAMGSSTNSGLGNMATVLTSIVNGATALMSTGFGQWIAKIGMYATAAGIAWAAWHAKTALMLASSRALAQAFSTQSASGTQLSFTLRGVMAQVRELRRETLAAQAAHNGAAAAARNHAAAEGQLAGSARAAGAAQAAGAGSGAAAGVGAAGKLVGILKGGLVLGGVTAGMEALNAVMGHFAERAERARQAAENIKQSASDLASAMDKDTQAYEKTGQAVSLFARATDAAGNTATSHVASVKEGANASQLMAEAQANLKGSVDGATGSIKTQVVAIGENTQKQIASMIASKNGVGGFADSTRKVLADLGFSVEDMSRKVGQGAASFGQYMDQIADKLRTKMNEALNSSDGSLADRLRTYGEYKKALEQVEAAQDHVAGSMAESTNKANDQAAAMEGLGGEANNAANEIDGMGDASDKAADKLDKMVDASFNGVMGQADLADAVANLGETVAKNGDNWDVYTEGGRANMRALEQAVHAAAQASGGDAVVFAQYVNQIQQNLVQNGIGALSILQQVAAKAMATVGNAKASFASAGSLVGKIANNIGVKSGAIQGSLIELPKLTAANNNLGRAYREGVAKNAERARKAMHRATRQKRRAGQAAKKAAKEIKTLSDYYSDLSGTANNAFNFRHGLEEATDKARDSLQKLKDLQKKSRDDYESAAKSARDAAKSVDDYRQKIDELHAQLLQLKADESKLQFHLKIATDYGDSLRAEDLRAKIAQNQADQGKNDSERASALSSMNDAKTQGASAANQMKAAQEALSRSLSGTTAASREQRAALRDLLKSYQDQVLAYANTGASQAQVRAYAARLSAEFYSQATAMGYSRAEIGRYMATFTDLGKIIARVPKKITISADTDPANRALNELSAKAHKASEDVNHVGSGSTATPNVGGTTGALGKIGGAAGAAGGAMDTMDDKIKKAAEVANLMFEWMALNSGKKMDQVSNAAKTGAGGFTVLQGHIISTKQVADAYLGAMAQTTVSAIDRMVSKIGSGMNYLREYRKAAEVVQGIAGVLHLSTGGLVPGAPGQLAFKPQGTDTVPAMLTPGEFVVKKSAVDALPPGFLEALNNGQVTPGSGSAPAGSALSMSNGPVIVELSPYDRALLGKAGNISLNLDGRAIASSVQGYNSNDTRRGF